MNAYAQGQQACFDGEPKSANPYEYDPSGNYESSPYWQWLEGYADGEIDREIWEDENFHRAYVESDV